jgi:hypothetical protein
MALSDEHRWICETKNFDEARYYREKEADEAYLAGLAARRGATEEERPEPKQHRINNTLKAELTALRSEVESLRQQLAAKVDAAWVRERLDIAVRVVGEETGKDNEVLLGRIRRLESEVESLRAQNVTSLRSRHVA